MPPQRAASSLVIVAALALLGHAALVLAGVFDAAGWVPIVECVAVCVIGLGHLRRVSEASDAAPAVPAAAPSGGPAIPARVAAPSIEPQDHVAGA